MGNPAGVEKPTAEPFNPETRAGAQNWHADRDALPAQNRPLDTPYVVMVHQAVNPFPGHTTSFADMQKAHEKLTAERRAWFEQQRGWYLPPFGTSRLEGPKVLHPLVHRQPFTGAPSLYVGSGNGRCILEGMEDQTQ